MNPADKLRELAASITQAATDATEKDHAYAGIGLHPDTREWAALIRPDAALALATWLGDQADYSTLAQCSVNPHALHLARLLLGEDQP